MPLQPIDLQTLFAHLNQVGKQQATLKEGAILQQVIKGNELAKEARLKDETVNQTQEEQEESAKVREKQPERKGAGFQEDKGRKKGEEKEEKQKHNFYEDPALGKNIDISG